MRARSTPVCTFLLAAAILVLGSAVTRAEGIKVGILKVVGSAPIYIGIDKGYFAAEGLTVEPVYFDAAGPIAVATVAGSVDIGAISTTGSLFNLGAQGALKIIAGQVREAPGFHALTFIVSNRAYAAGFKSYRDLAGRSIAVAQIGSSPHYSLALIAEKYGIDLRSMQVLPLQSIPNVISAVAGGQADGAITAATPVLAPIDRGEFRLMGFIGDETPWQLGAVFTATKTDTERYGMIDRFLRAFGKGVRDYHDAFADTDDKRRDGATATAVLGTIARYTEQPIAQVKLGISFIDSRLDIGDLQHQIDWFVAQNMLKPGIKIGDMLDKRVVVALPER